MTLFHNVLQPQKAIGLLLAATSGLAFAQAPAATEPQNSRLNSELFYELLVGEMSAQSGDYGTAYSLLLDAARKSNAPNAYERAVQFAIAGRNGDAALKATQAWTRAFPGAVDANRYLVQILVSLNRMPEIVSPLKRSMGAMVAKDKLATIETLPRYFARASDRALAATTVEQILTSEASDPTTGPLAWAIIGQMRLQAGNIQAAVAAAQRGAALNPLSPAAATLALALMQSAAADVEPIVTRYLAGQPAPEYRVAYVRYLVGARRLEEAYEQTLLLTTQAPTFPDGWLMRGSLELQMKKNEAAATALNTYVVLRTPGETNTESAEMDRPMVTAHVLLAQIAEQAGNYEQALGYLASVRSSSDAVRVGARQASILARQGKLKEARALIQGLPEETPDAARDKIAAEVQILRDQKMPDEAYAVMEQAVQRFPNDVDLKYDLAMQAEKRGKLDAMEQLMRQVIALRPDYHAAYNALGYSLADRNLRLGEARELLTKALEYAPSDPFIVDSMAWLEFRSGNTQEAARLLQGAFKNRPDAEIAAHLGEVLWALTQREQAEAIWGEGLRLNPENETLLETIRRLRGAP